MHRDFLPTFGAFWKEGYSAGKRDFESEMVSRCPYPLRSEAGYEWVTGWNAGMQDMEKDSNPGPRSDYLGQ